MGRPKLEKGAFLYIILFTTRENKISANCLNRADQYFSNNGRLLFLRSGRLYGNFRLWMSSSIFKFFTGFWQAVICIFIGWYIISIITCVGDCGLYLFNIYPVG